jgi:hypothetical protein
MKKQRTGAFDGKVPINQRIHPVVYGSSPSERMRNTRKEGV